MIKWIILGLLLAGGLIGGIIAATGGSGGGSNHSNSTMVTEDGKTHQDQAGGETPWTEPSYDEDYDHEDWGTSDGKDYYSDHPKDPPDMVPAPAPLLGGGVVGLTGLLIGGRLVRRGRKNQADINGRT